MTHMLKPILLLVLLAQASLAWASTQCTAAMAAVAEQGTDSLRTWKEVHTSFVKYIKCDDGALDEGYSDKVVFILTNGNGSLEELNHIIAHDPTFEIFVLDHLNELMSHKNMFDVDKVVDTQCPSDAQELCKIIRAKMLLLRKKFGGRTGSGSLIHPHGPQGPGHQ